MTLSPRIKFRCTSCEKPLSIGRKKIGATVTCPKCKSSIIVPDESEDLEREESEDNPFSEFQVFDDEFDEPELVYEDSIHGDDAGNLINDRLSVPRRVVYLQGALLGIVALVFFLLGLIVGSAGQDSNRTLADMAVIRGSILLGDQSPDEGAVVFLLPSKARPDTRFEAEELRPGRIFTSSNPEVPLIRKFGGNVCTTNRAGQFEVKIKPNREYILFVVSSGAPRSQELDSDYHAEVGHYFTSLENLADGKVCYFRRILPMNSNENVGRIVLSSGT